MHSRARLLDPRTVAAAGMLALTLAGAGTAQGLVADLNSSGGSSPSSLTDCGGTLFFTADDGKHGAELWKSDGSEAGTVLVKDIRSGSAGSAPRELTCAGNQLFFAADDGSNGVELWKSDGTAAGTSMVRDLQTAPANLTALRSRVYFVGPDFELWTSDGTAAGTSRFGAEGLKVWNLTAAADRVFFTASDGYLWMTDGTRAGTQQVLRKDATQLAAVGDQLFALSREKDGTAQLWKVALPSATPTRLSSIPTGRDFTADLIACNGLLFMATYGGGGFRLWTSNGTPTGTTVIRTYRAGSTELACAGNSVFFAGDGPGTGTELWKSDGTTSGTVMVADIRTTGRDPSSLPRNMVAVGNTLFFSADDGVHGRELWRTDGSETGTMRLSNISVSGSSTPSSVVESQGLLFFAATDDTVGTELFAMPSYRIEAYGTGCPGTGNAVPELSIAGTPQIGTSFAVRVANARADSVAVLLFGSQRANIALPPSGICSGLVSGVFAAIGMKTDANGTASLSMSLPARASVFQATTHVQWAIEDPHGSALGVATMSGAAKLVAGY